MEEIGIEDRQVVERQDEILLLRIAAVDHRGKLGVFGTEHHGEIPAHGGFLLAGIFHRAERGVEMNRRVLRDLATLSAIELELAGGVPALVVPLDLKLLRPHAAAAGENHKSSAVGRSTSA